MLSTMNPRMNSRNHILIKSETKSLGLVKLLKLNLMERQMELVLLNQFLENNFLELILSTKLLHSISIRNPSIPSMELDMYWRCKLSMLHLPMQLKLKSLVLLLPSFSQSAKMMKAISQLI
jgi:hypothetical protein